MTAKKTATAKKTTAKKSKKTTAKKTTSAKTATKKKTAAKKTSAKKTSAKKTAAKKTAAKKISAKKKTAAKKTAKKTAAKKTAAKKTAAKKTAAKKTAAKKTAAKKTSAPATAKTAAKKTSRSVPVSEQELLTRTLSAIAGVRPSTWTGGEAWRVTDEIVAAMIVCVEAGRAELARQLAEAVPTPQRGRAQMSLALAGHLDAEVATEALIAGLSLLDRRAACDAAAFARRAAAKLASGEQARELVAAADAAVDATIADLFGSDLEEVVLAYLEVGDLERVRSMLSLDEDELPESLAAGVWALGSPASIAPLITQGNAHEALNSPALELKGWSVQEIAKIADVAVGTWARPHLGEALVASGRLAEARTLVIDDPEWERLMPTWQVQRYLLVGEREAAEKILEGPVPVDDFGAWAKMQVELGVRGFAELWPLAAKRDPKDSVMAAVARVISLISAQLDAGAPTTEVGDAFAVVEALLAGKFRTPYDRGVEGSTRTSVASLRARIQIANGDLARAQAELEADWKGIASLLGYAKDAYARSLLLQGFARRAGEVARPDIALKAGKKIPQSRRPEVAASVARLFLPDDPAGALTALDALAKDEAAKRLLDGRGLLAALWSVVLGPPAAAV